MAHLDIDQFAGNALAHQRDSAAGPLTAAMRAERLEIGADGRVTLPAGSYEPLLGIAPQDDLWDGPIVVEVTQVSPAFDGTRSPLTFAPFSEKGGFLPYLCPAVGADNLLAQAITLQLRVRSSGRLLPPGSTRRLLHVRYSEGRFAKLLAVAQTETARTRRLAREIAARRTTDLAKGFMLDRVGRELAVPRLDSAIGSRDGDIVLSEGRESDEAYRRRLDIFRPFVMPTRAAVLEMLNGENSPLSRAGAPRTFGVLETDNPFMVGFKVFGVGATVAEGRQMRLNYLDHLRRTTWIDVAQNAPTARQLSVRQRSDENALRRRLRTALNFGNDAHRNMAPWLARAFDRAVRTLSHIGSRQVLNVVRAQQDTGGSRFELGLAAEVRSLTAAQITDLRRRVTAAGPSDDPGVQGTLVSLKAADMSAADGQWFFAACGFRTVVQLTQRSVLVSHVSMGSLNVEAPDGMDRTTARRGAAFQARLLDRGTQLDAGLANALAGGVSGWPPTVADWEVVPPARQSAMLRGAEFVDVPRAEEFIERGFAKLSSYPGFTRSLEAYPAHAVRVLKLGARLSDVLSEDTGNAAEMLGLIADTLGSNGAAAMLPLKSNEGLVLVVSSIGLPQIGTNIGPRRSSDFFWGATTISGRDVRVRGQGTRTLVKASGRGVYAAHTLAYARIGATDPFEWRITLPRDARITLAQYEILMNMLERMFPVGVEINTWDIRRHNVTLDDDAPTPLSPRLARSYRPFRRPRFQGSGDAQPATTSR